MHFEETICAPATIAGSGAISIVRLSGPRALEITDTIVRFRKGKAVEFRGGSIHFGEVLDSGQVLDEVLAAIFRAPHSYTGEDCVEISCHASAFIVSRMLALLCDSGARMAEPGEFTRRAFLAGKMDLSQAEAVADVIAANSEASLRVAMSQLKGAYSLQLRVLRDKLLELASLLELELDFSEEEVEFADRGKLRGLLEEASAHIASLVDSFRLGNAIRNGVPTAIVGAVNAGKSTLLNALVGHERAIVSDIPGTTRDTIEECLSIGGLQLRFIDTAGLRNTEDSVEKIGIERSLKALGEAEIVIAVIDGSVVTDLEDAIREFLGMIDRGHQRLIVAVNKMDLRSEPAVGGGECLEGLGCKSGQDEDALKGVRICPICAATGEIASLRNALEACCREIASLREDSTVVTNLRHYEALRHAATSLDAISRGLSLNIPGDLIAEDLRAAILSLGSILGETISADEILGEIFGRFCIGK